MQTETNVCAGRRLAIIPARGGSKRIPRKNIRDFRGKPIIAWSLDAALTSELFDEVLVSTDSPQIASVAREFGAAVPFLRSAESSDDYATTADVILEVLRCYEQEGQCFDEVCCLYPTAPFVTAASLQKGLSLLRKSKFDAVFPVVRYDYPIWRSLKVTENGKVALNFPENLNVRSQDLPPAYHDAGQWYWLKTASFLRDGIVFGDNTGSIQLPASQVQDIDTEEDWATAEMKHAMLDLR
ncbi:MAG: pseudaminic acid cytidylyltransferase [Roseobacter sp.]